MPTPTDPLGAAERATVRARVLARVARGPVAPAELLRKLCTGAGRTRPAVQAAIRELVAAGEIAYTLEHGRSVLEPSFDRPVRVSERITLTPPEKCDAPPAGGVLVRLAAGAAFGAGRHPTTRLALRGIDFALKPGTGQVCGGGRVLDVGTGTGVLAIAAIALGMAGGLGIDPDPCAIAEARHNVRLNGMENRLLISDQMIADIDESFALVAANLRAPSLVGLSGTLRARLGSGGGLVVAGMRTEERAAVVAAIEGVGLRTVWQEEEGGWAAVLLKPSSK
jgi:ribosomal protein L11 methyltransferase